MNLCYANHHSHSEMSNFKNSDCIIKVSDYVDWAIRYGYNGATLSDHEALSGHVRFIQRYQELKKQKKNLLNGEEVEETDLVQMMPENFKIGLGNEIYLMNRQEVEDAKNNYQRGITKFWHFILIAKNRKGYDQLKRISSSAWNNWWKAYGQSRVPTIEEDLVEIIGENKGNLIASSACLGSRIDQLILQVEQGDKSAKHKIDKYIKWCIEVFGKENFFLELQPCENPFYEEEDAFGEKVQKTHEQVIVNRWLVKIAKAYGLQWQVTCDSHYVSKDDIIVQDAFLNSDEEGKGNRETADFYASAHMWKPEELYDNLCLFLDEEDVIKAFEGTQSICEMLEEYDIRHDTVIPEDKKVPENIEVKNLFREKGEIFDNFYDSPNKQDRYLIHLIENGMIDHGTIGNQKYIDRVAKELNTIWDVSIDKKQSMGAYYVMVRNIVRNCIWPVSLVGPGRGSACGFYISRAIGITQVDPVYWGMPDWRHLDRARPDFPDIDLDSEQSKRSAILQNMREYFGEENVLNCCTFTTLKSKQAILTACRGLGIDGDIAQMIASMVPFERGANWPIKDCLYGNDELNRQPIVELKNEFDKYEELERIVLQLEGLITGVSIHASAVYIFSNGYIELNSLMRAPNGAYVTAFNMHDSDVLGGLKFDSLTIKNLDCIHTCLDSLIRDGYLEDKGSLKANYDAYVHPEVIDVEDPKAWNLLNSKRLLSAFQFDTSMGVTAIEAIQPTSIRELALGNSLMRLMGEEDEDTPMQKYAKNKENIQNWYEEMKQFGLSQSDIEILVPHLLPVKGVCAEQESLMTISMDEKIAGFDTVQANVLRKAIAKKTRNVLMKAQKMFFDEGRKRNTSEELLNYVWHHQFKMSFGYSFSFLHSLAYSYICCQEMHLANKFPIEYWDCSVLSVNAASDEDTDKSTNYGVIAATIGQIIDVGGKVELPSINKAQTGFIPIPEENTIVFALKGISGVNDQIAKAIIANRPYTSFDDFYAKMQAWKAETKIPFEKIAKEAHVDTLVDLAMGDITSEQFDETTLKKGIREAQKAEFKSVNKIGDSVITTLIKAGCFDEFEDRRQLLRRFIRQQTKQLTRLSWENLSELENLSLIPSEYELQIRLVKFRKWLFEQEPYKKEGKSNSTWWYEIPKKAVSFYEQNLEEFIPNGKITDNELPLIKRGSLDKAIDIKTVSLKEDFISNPTMLEKVNDARFQEVWDKYEGTLSAWEMSSVNYYSHEHELNTNIVDEEYYSISSFKDMPPEGIVLEINMWMGKEKPRFQLYRIAGTVLDKDKNKHIVTVLTPYGVVPVKFYKGQFNFYDTQLSEIDNDGKKTVLEKSWFKRGTKLLITGYRRQEQFVPKRYSNSLFRHSVQLIEGFDVDRKLILRAERVGQNDDVLKEDLLAKKIN